MYRAQSCGWICIVNSVQLRIVQVNSFYVERPAMNDFEEMAKNPICTQTHYMPKKGVAALISQKQK